MTHLGIDSSLLTSVPGVRIRELDVPATADDPDHVACVELVNDVEAELVGHRRLDGTAVESYPDWQPSRYRRRHRWLAEVDGRVVAVATLGLPVQEATDTAYPAVWVRSEHRRGGIGTALRTVLEQAAAAERRTVLQGWATAGHPDGETLASPTGFGAVGVDLASTRFLTGSGYRLQQVERCSVLVLSDARGGLEQVRDVAAAAAGPDYDVVVWPGAAPEQWAEDAAWMNSRMSTDAPSGELKVEEETWDVARLRESEERHEQSGREMLVVAARHLPSDHLVAYTSLSLPTDPAVPEVFQWDTLVTREHRGHRLGMLIKAINLLELAARRPQTEVIITWNAEENRPMLDVNEALGFAPDHWNGAWERRQEDPAPAS